MTTAFAGDLARPSYSYLLRIRQTAPSASAPAVGRASVVIVVMAPAANCFVMLTALFSGGARAQDGGVCDFSPSRGGKPTKGPCSAQEFEAAVASKAPGNYDFQLPQGGCGFHRQVDIGEGQVVTVRARDDPRSPDDKPTPVKGRFTVGGNGQLVLDHVHLEGQHLALLVAGEGAVVRASRCEFANNRHEWAGAIALLAGELDVVDSLFSNNECSNAAYGGTIFVRSGTLSLQGTDFEGNRAGRGGAIFVDDGAAGDKAPNIMVDKCKFNANEAPQGSAIYIKDTKSLDVGWAVRDSTFTGNKPDEGCVTWDGINHATEEHRAWTNAEANMHGLPNGLGPHPKPITIKCDPRSLPKEFCPGGIACPQSGECPPRTMMAAATASASMAERGLVL